MTASSPSSLRVAIAGASGRMGHMLIEAVLASGDCQLAAALDQPGSPGLGQDAAAFLGKATGVLIESEDEKGERERHGVLMRLRAGRSPE